jgi:hypothetical protein
VAINPVNDVLLLNVHNRVNMRGEFVIYDAQGKMVKRLNRTMQEGNYQIAIPVEGISPGFYMIGFSTEIGAVFSGIHFLKI